MTIHPTYPNALHQTSVTRGPRQSGHDQNFAALLDNKNNTVQRQPTEQKAALSSDSPLPLQLAGQNASDLIALGEINNSTPSVSHLLNNHPDLRRECWDIIHAKVNENKGFTSIRPGVKVSLNPTTKEIVLNPLLTPPLKRDERNYPRRITPSLNKSA